MQANALDGILVVDVAGTVATSYCAKLFADYGADVVNLEPVGGFLTRQLEPFLPAPAAPQISAMHAYLHTNKRSVEAAALASTERERLVARAALVLDADGALDRMGLAAETVTGVHSSVEWFGTGGPYENFVGTDAACFALNGMLRGIGPIAGPPLIPTGYQAQVTGGITAFITSLTQVFAGELGNRTAPIHIETSIFEAMLCFTDVGAIGAHNTGLETPRMGVNRFPPTYPLGVFPCKDGWLGLTVLTPSQWHSFCRLLDIEEFAELPLFQTAIGRLEAADILEPVICEKLLEHSAEDLFYRGQESGVPLARVPTMAELFEVDQFSQRNAFCDAIIGVGDAAPVVRVPSVPFRLFSSPPHFGGPVADMGQHTAAVQLEISQ